MTDQFPMGGTEPAAWRLLTAHPLAELFPLMSEAELAELADDIKKNGLREDIVLYEGQILDGRNRHAACLRCGIEPRFVDFPGDDPLAFIVSMNLYRRHLSREAKGEVVTRILKETKGKKSDRAVGRMAHVDHKTVASKRAELEGSGEIPHFDTREDRKGHSRPAHKAPASASRPADIEAADKELADYKTWIAQGAMLGDLVSDDVVGVAIDATDCADPPLGLTSERSRREALDSQATIAFMGVLRDGDIYRHLDELLGMLRDEKERIAALPTSQRESLARGFRLFAASIDHPETEIEPCGG